MSTQTLSLVPCTHCGASLPIEPGVSVLGCVFCGGQTQTRIPETLASAEHAQEAQSESVAALEEVLLRHYAPKSSGRVAMMFCSIVVCIGVIAVGLQIGFAAGTNVIGVCGFVVGFGFLLTGLFYALLADGGARKATNAALSSVHTQITERPQKGGCSRCGASVQVPRVVAVFQCSHCQTSLVAAEGMLIEWAADANERARRWQAQTSTLLARVQLAERTSGCLAPVVWIVLTLVSVPILGGLVFVSRLVLGLD